MGVSAEELRARMIATLRERGILRGGEIERAFTEVPRHLFLPGVPLEKVYSGDVIPTKHDANGAPISSSSEVAVMVCMIEMLELHSGQRVLEIGAGTGYNAAILATLAGAHGSVTTVELDAAFADEAREHLAAARFARVRVVTADGWDGDPGRGSFDRVILTASARDVSPPWIEQLVDDGRLVLPLATEPGPQILVAFRKDGDDLVSTSTRAGGFMPLRGGHATAPDAVSIGQYDVEPRRVAAAAEDALREILSHPPVISVGAPLRYEHYAMLALAESDCVSVRRRGQQGFAVGLIDVAAPGLALVEMSGSAVGGPLTHLVTFGSPRAAERLRERIAEITAIDPREIRIRARRTADGERHYRFALEERVAA